MPVGLSAKTPIQRVAGHQERQEPFCGPFARDGPKAHPGADTLQRPAKKL